MTDELRLERVIDAPPDVVFEAFTTRGGQVAFYGTDDPGWIVESQCDLRVGGLWTVTFGPSPDHLYHHRNVFEIIDRPRRIVLATTELHPDRPSFDFSVEYTFEEQDGQTLMTVIQSGFPTPELRDEHGRGAPDSNAPSARASKTGFRHSACTVAPGGCSPSRRRARHRSRNQIPRPAAQASGRRCFHPLAQSIVVSDEAAKRQH